MERPPMLEHFAEELRLARARAEMSQADLAGSCNYSAAMIAKVETCERRPSLDLARRCDAILGTGGLLERIQRRIGQESVVGYFQEFAGIEQEAKALRCFQPTFIPGLLQTEPYARAVLSSSGLLTSEETEEQVATRLHRQEILSRATPPLLTAVLDETALRRPIGGPAVMRDQLLHLVKVGNTLPRVRIHVVPASAGAYAGLDGPLVIATPPLGEPVAYLEGHIHGKVIDHPEQVRHMLDVWDSIRGEALPHQRSIELIAEVAQTWS